uniref:Uncharacterized protein n=1 Tax=Romanomermis culicivorax TaxID=13658 RepID=A0A915JKN0_ROMCU
MVGEHTFTIGPPIGPGPDPDQRLHPFLGHPPSGGSSIELFARIFSDDNSPALYIEAHMQTSHFMSYICYSKHQSKEDITLEDWKLLEDINGTAPAYVAFRIAMLPSLTIWLKDVRLLEGAARSHLSGHAASVPSILPEDPTCICVHNYFAKN